MVIKALIKFLSTFGLPKTIQTDQGTNFTSKVFAQVVDKLQIKYVMCTSAAWSPVGSGMRVCRSSPNITTCFNNTKTLIVMRLVYIQYTKHSMLLCNTKSETSKKRMYFKYQLKLTCLS